MQKSNVVNIPYVLEGTRGERLTLHNFVRSPVSACMRRVSIFEQRKDNVTLLSKAE